MANEYAEQWWAKESPSFSYRCECGIMVTGNSENGLHTLIARHQQKGKIHLEYKEKQ
jgi:hypothetical protein